MSIRQLNLLVKDQDPLRMGASETVKEACRRMWERRVGAVLVTDDKNYLVGIFTGRDAVRVLAEGKSAARTRLSAAMSRSPETIAPERSTVEALRAMNDGGYRHLPVVAGTKIMGIVSRGDFKGLELDRLEVETQLWERLG